MNSVLPPDTRITVAGCGSMGLPMASALLASGFDVQGLDVRPIAAPFPMVSPERGADCDLLLSIVRDAAQSQQLLYGSQGVLRQTGRPKAVIVCSTLSRRDLAALAAQSPAGLVWIDAPMSGAPIAAQQRQLSFMIGGAADWVRALWPLFEAMGAPDRLFHLGPFGAGMAVKLLNNFVAASNVVASRWAFDQARAQNIPLATLRAVMAVSSGQNWFASRFEEIIFAREGFADSNTMGIIHKDVTAAIDGQEAPLGQALRDALTALTAFDDPPGSA